MSFETGGESQNPFENEETDEEAVEEADSERPDDVEDQAEPAGEPPKHTQRAGTGSESGRPSSLSTQEVRESADPPTVDEIDITEEPTPTELAQALIDADYHSESPPVSYSQWRDGTSTSRGRTTIELNGDVDKLVKQAMREFENQYDAEINKADLREFALVWGLANLEDVFKMAEEWGLQY